MKFSLAKAVAGGTGKQEKRPAEQLQETSKRAKVLKARQIIMKPDPIRIESYYKL